MNFYDDYKPLRNYLRKFPLVDSLLNIWALSREVIEEETQGRAPIVGRPLRYRRLPIYGWQIETLCRELVLNAPDNGTLSLMKWKHLAKAFDLIGAAEEAAFNANGKTMDIMLEVHRSAHRQFPWQNSFSHNSVVRAIKIFGQKEVDNVISSELGMTSAQVTALGIAMAGHFRGSPYLSNPGTYRQLGISAEALKAYLGRTCYSLKDLVQKTREQQRYDHDWAYTFNPLVEKPLVAIGTDQGLRILCPIPRLLTLRATGGIYYDIARSKSLSTPYGLSFESYVGEVLDTTCPTPGFRLLPETSYYIGRQEYRGPDWILSDATAHVFIEAKTKRMRLDAKIHSDPAALERELDLMAGLVLQHYANIDRALKGHMPNWKPDSRPIIPMLVTLEDWYLLGATARDLLLAKVRSRLAHEGLDPDLVASSPFIVVSMNELEVASQIMAKLGIGAVILGKRQDSFMPHSGLLNDICHRFPKEFSTLPGRIFETAFNQFFEDVKALLASGQVN